MNDILWPPQVTSNLCLGPQKHYLLEWNVSYLCIYKESQVRSENSTMKHVKNESKVKGVTRITWCLIKSSLRVSVDHSKKETQHNTKRLNEYILSPLFLLVTQQEALFVIMVLVSIVIDIKLRTSSPSWQDVIFFLFL